MKQNCRYERLPLVRALTHRICIVGKVVIWPLSTCLTPNFCFSFIPDQGMGRAGL